MQKKQARRISGSIVAVSAASLLIYGCSPGQFLGPTVTPSPTNTPPPTPASTPTAVPTSTQIPTPMGGGSQIAFASNRNGNWEIYRMNSDGTDTLRLTTLPRTEEYFPKLAVDGSWLLFWSYMPDQAAAELDWLNPDGTTGQYISGVMPYSAISPDGSKVLVTSYFGGKMDISVVPAEGGDLVRLTNNPANDYQPCWSADGKIVLFVSERDGDPHLYVMDVDGKNQRRLTSGDASEVEPSWSPDGDRIAYLVPDNNFRSSIYVANADGSESVNITGDGRGLNENPAWSPDGEMIAFWSDRTGDHEIFIMRADGSQVTNITNNPAEDENPSWGK